MPTMYFILMHEHEHEHEQSSAAALWCTLSCSRSLDIRITIECLRFVHAVVDDAVVHAVDDYDQSDHDENVYCFLF